MATALLYARQALHPTGSVHLTPEAVPETLDEAYALSRTSLGGAEVAGWKLGGTNHTSKAAFGVKELYYGPLQPSEILHRPAIAPGFALAELKGEVEIALRIGPDGSGYDAWCVALELPSSPIANLVEAGVRALVADRCAAGALILGPVQEGALPDTLSCERFYMAVDGHDLARAGYEALVADPAQLLADFLALAVRHGDDPRHGQWVATGGITPCRDFAAEGRVTVRMGDTEMIDFRAATGGQP
ncbi:hypothetical protein [Alterinioella nitratireducens]|uniref:hypothetical protein n=1 Tax=Alterinioella nitratireducens TaxID=2735915 RepID=UPI0015520CD2|nr:hypothetical protein [Alterinioella nitratireducens]NPD21282.1 hypothetical protein [Alterinioella nitratireducens]